METQTRARGVGSWGVVAEQSEQRLGGLTQRAKGVGIGVETRGWGADTG